MVGELMLADDLITKYFSQPKLSGTFVASVVERVQSVLLDWIFDQGVRGGKFGLLLGHRRSPLIIE